MTKEICHNYEIVMATINLTQYETVMATVTDMNYVS